MSNADSVEAETMQGAFQLGYSRKQIINSTLLALLLHGAIIGGYLALGSEKKPPQPKVAAKDDKKDGATPAGKDATATKSDSPKSDGKSDAASTDEGGKKAPEKVKGVEASKASELPTAPDSDIDSILKAK